MMKQNKSLRKNTQKTLSILDTNLDNRNENIHILSEYKS